MNHELLNGWLLENDCLNRFSFIQVFGHHSNPVWDALFKGDSGFLNLKCLEPESEQKRTWTVRDFGCISSAVFGYDSNISHRNQVERKHAFLEPYICLELVGEKSSNIWS